MAKYQDYSSFDEEQTLAWDLRQGYTKLLSAYLEDVYIAKKATNYREWFRILSMMWAPVVSRVEKKPKETEKNYKEIRQETINVMNDNASVFLGKSKNPEGIHKVEEALLEMEQFVMTTMNENNMFGFKREDEGL